MYNKDETSCNINIKSFLKQAIAITDNRPLFSNEAFINR